MTIYVPTKWSDKIISEWISDHFTFNKQRVSLNFEHRCELEVVFLTHYNISIDIIVDSADKLNKLIEFYHSILHDYEGTHHNTLWTHIGPTFCPTCDKRLTIPNSNCPNHTY